MITCYHFYSNTSNMAVMDSLDRFFTWWPFWKGAKQRNLGQRIDYVLTNAPLTAKLESVTLHREYGTSDHAPLEANFTL